MFIGDINFVWFLCFDVSFLLFICRLNKDIIWICLVFFYGRINGSVGFYKFFLVNIKFLDICNYFGF